MLNKLRSLQTKMYLFWQYHKFVGIVGIIYSWKQYLVFIVFQTKTTLPGPQRNMELYILLCLNVILFRSHAKNIACEHNNNSFHTIKLCSWERDIFVFACERNVTGFTQNVRRNEIVLRLNHVIPWERILLRWHVMLYFSVMNV